MTYTLPERRILVHKAIDREKLSKKNQPSLEELDDPRLYSREAKYDGCHVIIIAGPGREVLYFSRDGKPCSSLEHHTPYIQKGPSGRVYFAEAWRPGAEFRVINGEFRRKKVQPGLQLRVFDVVPLLDFEEGHCNRTYSVRRTACAEYVALMDSPLICLSSAIAPGDEAALANDPDNAFDGGVAKLWTGTWTAGAGTGGEVIKVKNAVDLDLEVIGVEEEHDKHGQPKGRLGAVVCRFEGGVELRVGSGFSSLERAAWWAEPNDIIGRVVRVVGMKASGKGSIREPRFKGVRHDKLMNPDY